MEVTMQLSAARRIVLVWVLLSAMTLASWQLGAARGHREFSPSTTVTVGIVVAAALKVWLIIRHFMEVRTAPVWLRRTTDGWLALLVASILALYLW
jgi:hypothetical protein